MSDRIKISDGSSWPRPCMEADDPALTHVLTYGEPTREQLLAAVQIISAYSYLVLGANQKKRDLVVREVRRAITASADSSNGDDRG